ncbi:MAG: DUF2185 domain-containing protein [Proteobacteria bacterium]|nr:DUF2185 domain-containing protein [Pseudomonadota bacterium]
MSPQMESIIQTIASFKEAISMRQAELAEQDREILDEETFCTVLSGLPSFRRLPGVPEHMGFEGLYHCDTPENAQELKDYLQNVFGITDEETLVQQKQEFFHIFNEYYDFACEWDGSPNFEVDELEEEGKAAYTNSRDFSALLRDFVGQQGYAAWDIGERIMLIRAACACGIIEDNTAIRLIVDEAKIANELFDNFGDYAISALCGCVYFMFVSMGRTEEEGLSGFLEINMQIISKLFEDDIWSLNAWMQKNFKQLAIRDEQVQQILGEEYQGLTAVAADRILCDGYRISVMLREPSVAPSDSGWRFFAGDEDQEYLADGNNFGALDLNLIINYSPDCADFLDMPVGTFIVRNDEGILEVMPTPQGTPDGEPIAFG